jgi:flagellar protein FliO/FliZ
MESLLLSIASTVLALIVVLALAYVVLRVLRRPLLERAGRSGDHNDAMTFVRALPLGPKERVVLIDYRGARWMLGVTAGGISVLESWPDASAGAAQPARATPSVPASPAPPQPSDAAAREAALGPAR